jgi:uncharacterized protein
MFGFSFQKLLFTVLAIAAVWYAFKWIGRLQEDRQSRAKVNRRSARPADRGARTAAPRAGEDEGEDVEEMVKCPVCGDYVAKTAAVNCGRDGCPYPG